MKREIFAGVYSCSLTIFCVLRKLIFVIRTDWFSCWELTFAIVSKLLIIVSFLLSRWNGITSFKTILWCAFPM